MSETEDRPVVEEPQDTEQGPDQPKEQQSFTQADVDRIVRERVQRERAKYADYEDLKSRAGEKASLEERLAAMERSYNEAQTRAMRSDVAAQFKIGPEDRDLFLTGSDEETLIAQATRLAERLNTASQPRAPKPDPNQGRPGGSPKTTADSFADFFNQQLH